jgi:hypothetical protein
MTVQMTTFEDEGAEGTAPPGPVTALAVLPDAIHEGPTSREVAIEDLLRLLDASRRLMVTLAANAEICEASVRKMMDGMAPAAVLTEIDVAGARLDLAETLGSFERARHRSRSTFIAAQYESGMNMKEIARNWAISRQLAHRFFKEAGRDD